MGRTQLYAIYNNEHSHLQGHNSLILVHLHIHTIHFDVRRDRNSYPQLEVSYHIELRSLNYALSYDIIVGVVTTTVIHSLFICLSIEKYVKCQNDACCIIAVSSFVLISFPCVMNVRIQLEKRLMCGQPSGKKCIGKFISWVFLSIEIVPPQSKVKTNMYYIMWCNCTKCCQSFVIVISPDTKTSNQKSNSL